MGRTTMNALSVCCTIGFLLLATTSFGAYTSGIQRMTTDINRAIRRVLQQLENITYDEFEYTATYDSSTAFHPKGMNILYNLTHALTKGVLPEVIPDALLVDEHGVRLRDGDDGYAKLARTYAPALALIGVLALFAVCMPLCGFCFCCCRCCCNSGKARPIEKHKDLCQKVCFATLMIAMGTLLLFGVVCAFVSNEHMQDGTNALTDNLRVGMADTKKYFDETNRHVEVLLNRNFHQLSTVLLSTLEESSTILYDELKQITNASSIDDAMRMVTTMEQTLTSLRELKKLTNTLRVEASQLDDAMRKIKRDLLEDLNKCSENKACSQMKQEYVDKLGTGIDFNSIPDISADINTINDMLTGNNLIQAIHKGEAQLARLKTQIKEEVNGNIRIVQQKVDATGKEIARHSKDVRKTIDDYMSELMEKSTDGLKIADDYIGEYGKYRHYVGLTISCVFLFVTICIVLGLICGICGKKPTYGDDCCNKGAGSRFLMCGVAVMFLTACALVVVLVAHLFAGMLAQALVCEPLRHPRTSEAMDFYDEHVDLKKLLGIDTRLKVLVTNCYANRSAYEVFNLKSRFDIGEVRTYITKFGIDKELASLEDAISLETRNFELLSKEEIARLVKLGVDLNDINDKFDRIIDEIKIEDFTTVKLEELQTNLGGVIRALDQRPSNGEIVASLRLSALHLDTYIEKLFKPMVQNANATLALAQDTNEALKFGQASFKAAIDHMADQIDTAQEELRDNGQAKIQEVVRMFTDNIMKVLKAYLDRVADSVERDVGRCGPLALVVNGTLTSTCDKIILPMTGFGVSILWCILMFIPTIFFSVKLADLYKKTDYCYTDAVNLYDAYADRENIPLARTKYAGKKKHKKKRYETRGYRPDSEHAGRCDFAGGSQHSDARYSDMAPKHYEDFPNGGPPQYHRATEYERPPPYYCPGSSDH